MKKLVIFLLAIFEITIAVAQCRQIGQGAFYPVVCPDGNTYTINRNQTFDTTSIQGSNPNTGNQWSQEYRGNSISGPTMNSIDAKGNQSNCRYSQLPKKWQCF